MAKRAPQKTDFIDRPEFSNAEIKKARAWFENAESSRHKQSYDYAVESYVTGLGFWPEAVEEGLGPFKAAAIQRMQAGGKKPGMMETMRLSVTGKDAKKALHNALTLFGKDPTNPTYMDAVLANALKCGYLEMVKWIASWVLDSIRREKKKTDRLSKLVDRLVEAGETAAYWNDHGRATAFYEDAVRVLEYGMARSAGDAALKDQHRDVAGKLTISKGKYATGDSFRDSIQDAESQQLLHDEGRSRQSASTGEAVVSAAREAHQANPDDAAALTRYIDLLSKHEDDDHENEAIEVLERLGSERNNYGLQVRADDLRMRQLRRHRGAAEAAYRKQRSPETKQAYITVAKAHLKTELRVFKERARRYPTDMRIKYKYGQSLFTAKRYDDAIPILQEAQNEPRHRTDALLLIGRAFHESGAFSQAREVLREVLSQEQVLSEGHRKEIMYRLALALEANGEVELAKDEYGKLLRMDYNYAGGDARKRLDALNARTTAS